MVQPAGAGAKRQRNRARSGGLSRRRRCSVDLTNIDSFASMTQERLSVRDLPGDCGSLLPLHLLRAARVRDGKRTSALLEGSVTVTSADTHAIGEAAHGMVIGRCG